MKRTLFALLLLLLLPTTATQAQTAVTLESLEVALWPDYDKESVLVLLTGTLAANTPLPATITFPLPDDADFNVVARITSEGVLTDQGITPQVGINQVTFTTPDTQFHVEYYQPYTTTNNQRDFTFSWQSDIPVEQMSVKVQQPLVATDLTTVPAATSFSEENGLTYHLLPSRSVAAGDTYTVELNYTMSTPQLTANLVTPNAEATELPFLDATPVEEPAFDWALLLIALGVLILVATAVWYLVNRQSTISRRPTRPKPKRQPKPPASKTAAAQSTFTGQANFCHQCGEALQAEDKFCRNCGTAVKGK